MPDTRRRECFTAQVELLLCARAAIFVGTWPSTFSATIVAQRDARGLPRNTTAFFGFAPGDAPWDDSPPPAAAPALLQSQPPGAAAVVVDGGVAANLSAPAEVRWEAGGPALRVSASRVVPPSTSLGPSLWQRTPG